MNNAISLIYEALNKVLRKFLHFSCATTTEVFFEFLILPNKLPVNLKPNLPKELFNPFNCCTCKKCCERFCIENVVSCTHGTIGHVPSKQHHVEFRRAMIIIYACHYPAGRRDMVLQ